MERWRFFFRVISRYTQDNQSSSFLFTGFSMRNPLILGWKKHEKTSPFKKLLRSHFATLTWILLLAKLHGCPPVLMPFFFPPSVVSTIVKSYFFFAKIPCVKLYCIRGPEGGSSSPGESGQLPKMVRPLGRSTLHRACNSGTWEFRWQSLQVGNKKMKNPWQMFGWYFVLSWWRLSPFKKGRNFLRF